MLREDSYFEDVSDAPGLAGAGWDSTFAPDSEPDYFARGLRYSTGRGVKLDLIQAHKWFNIAALRGNAQARQYRGEIAQEMTRQEIAEAQRQARDWLSRQANLKKIRLAA